MTDTCLGRAGEPQPQQLDSDSQQQLTPGHCCSLWMTPFNPSVLPLEPGTTLPDQLSLLSQLKNQLIGFTKRKQAILQHSGAVQ